MSSLYWTFTNYDLPAYAGALAAYAIFYWSAALFTYKFSLKSNTAMLSTCAVCGNMLTMPAAVQRLRRL
jgi:hypothetical protein